MKYSLTFLIFLTFACSSAAQNGDVCVSDKKLAERIIQHDSLVLYEWNETQFSLTQMELMHRDYHFYPVRLWNDKQEFSTHTCFLELMKLEVEKRHDANFLERSKAIADSLDRVGMGLKVPNPSSEFMNKISALISELKFEGANDVALSYYQFKIDLDAEGNLTRIEATGFTNKSTTNRPYYAKAPSNSKLFKELKITKWKPAIFRNEPIDFSLVIPINVRLK